MSSEKPIPTRSKWRFLRILRRVENTWKAANDRLSTHAWYGPHGDLKLFALIIATTVFAQIRNHENIVVTESVELPVQMRVAARQDGKRGGGAKANSKAAEAARRGETKTVLDFYVSDEDGKYTDGEGKVIGSVKSKNEFFSTGNKLPKQVSVTLKGRPSDVKKLDLSGARIVVEVQRGAEVSERDVMAITKIPESAVKKLLGNVGGIEIAAIKPAYVRYAWDDAVEKKVVAADIYVPKIGEPFHGGEAHTEILADEIFLQGSKEMFKHMNAAGWKIATEPVDVSGRAANFIERVKIEIPRDSGIIGVNPGYVNVRVTFTTAEDSKSSVSGPDIPMIDIPISELPGVGGDGEYGDGELGEDDDGDDEAAGDDESSGDINAAGAVDGEESAANNSASGE
jgi:hypothetical protein